MPTLESLFLKLKDVKVIDQSIPYMHYTPIDLSVWNTNLTQMDLKNPQDFELFIENHLHKNNAKIAFGGYNEERNLYDNRTLFEGEQSEKRNMHIGMDLWIKAGTPILAAVDGIVHSFNFNAGSGNYGPTIILEHCIDNQIFYTLYGHLALESIEKLAIGTAFRQGEPLGTLGDSAVNGGYSPHLHFQIIKNIADYVGDYPGVCSKKDLTYYLENCPDPNLLLKIK
ncbi:peptidoglycan DD-metalloendopeptidase family protein [Flavobacterium nackdongense]|uniref:Peptidase M23 n=1 Tax=Flavobacterium nackdongense TaxID=2547394 RepID=A0A4P6YAF5_9FLAO|nr:peptidoglycan DD-metalloendopeptidase family protein [Flavobacterium nackdongense]QBN17714.1 peptidase M23 [Flavobacterium nackdongense]